MDDFDFMGQDFLNAKPPEVPSPTPVPRRRKHKVPERDRIFSAQKHVYNALQESMHLNAEGKLQDGDKLIRDLRKTYHILRKYLQEHTEAR